MKELKNINLFEFDFDEKKNSASKFIIGVDEAGRGPAAGGVWASAVCFRENIDVDLFSKLNDSKKLKPKIREELYEIIKNNAYCAIKAVNVEKIEQINILQASLLAMRYAVMDVAEQIYKDKKLYQHKPNEVLVLVDGNKLIKDIDMPQKFVIKGDAKSASIAAASILAKVSRDRYMDKIHLEYPHYDWVNNKGYLTKKHIEAIKNYGITKYHRPSFLKNICY